MSFTPAERLAWREHFRRFPHGDFYTQKLLADLVAMLGSFLSSKQISIEQVAPWLFPDKRDGEVEITPPSPDNDLILKSLQAIQDKKNDAKKY